MTLTASIADINIEILMEMLTEAQRDLEMERAARIAVEEKLAAIPAIVPQKIRTFRVTVIGRDSQERVAEVDIKA